MAAAGSTVEGGPAIAVGRVLLREARMVQENFANGSEAARSGRVQRRIFDAIFRMDRGEGWCFGAGQDGKTSM